MPSPLLLAVVLLLAASTPPYVSTASSAEQREFDYFLLSLQWPGTYCQTTRHCCPNNGCCRSLPLTEFTIHGLWTDYNDGTWPSCCSGSEFDLKKISSLIPMLEKYWPTLSCSSSSLCHGGKGLFWAHEWEKHGTCSYPVIQNERDYFSTALDLYFKFNITRILESAGFQATYSERYPLVDIIAAVEKAVGASPSLVCKHGALEELHLCFYKDFKPRDCVIGSNAIYDWLKSRSSCPRYITLPTYEPLAVEKESAAVRSSPAMSFASNWRDVDLIQELFGW